MSALRTALYDWHAARKARLIEFGGWEMPVQYTGIIDEHTAVRTRAGLFDISHMGRLSFSGKDALPFIERVFTNNATKMKDFQVRYGLICNENGGILDDILVYRFPYGWAMVVNASNRVKILDWFESNRGSLDVQWVDQTLSTVNCSKPIPLS
jgi:aminomethyltransferase